MSSKFQTLIRHIFESKAVLVAERRPVEVYKTVNFKARCLEFSLSQKKNISPIEINKNQSDLTPVLNYL